MIEVPRSERGEARPSWFLWRGRVYMKCPNGHIGSLEDHQVQPDGNILPSVVCPEAGCGFHEMVRLLEYDVKR